LCPEKYLRIVVSFCPLSAPYLLCKYLSILAIINI